jgi:hypothetical protein
MGEYDRKLGSNQKTHAQLKKNKGGMKSKPAKKKKCPWIELAKVDLCVLFVPVAAQCNHE